MGAPSAESEPKKTKEHEKILPQGQTTMIWFVCGSQQWRIVVLYLPNMRHFLNADLSSSRNPSASELGDI